MFGKLIYVIVLDWDNVCVLFLWYMFLVICGEICEVYLSVEVFFDYVSVDVFL